MRPNTRRDLTDQELKERGIILGRWYRVQTDQGQAINMRLDTCWWNLEYGGIRVGGINGTDGSKAYAHLYNVGRRWAEADVRKNPGMFYQEQFPPFDPIILDYLRRVSAGGLKLLHRSMADGRAWKLDNEWVDIDKMLAAFPKYGACAEADHETKTATIYRMSDYGKIALAFYEAENERLNPVEVTE